MRTLLNLCIKAEMVAVCFCKAVIFVCFYQWTEGKCHTLLLDMVLMSFYFSICVVEKGTRK